MAKIKAGTKDGKLECYHFLCPGCECLHGIWMKENPNPITGATWDFNMDMDRPTVSPSLLVDGRYGPNKEQGFLCHSYITAGKIKFISDSTHPLSGQEVELPQI